MIIDYKVKYLKYKKKYIILKNQYGGMIFDPEYFWPREGKRRFATKLLTELSWRI